MRFLLMLLLAFQVPGAAKPTPATDQDPFAALRDQWAKDLKGKFVDDSLAQYAPDADFVSDDGRTHGTAALRQLINKVGRPLFERMLGLIGGMIGLPANDDKTRLCAISVMGQILVYVFSLPLLTGVWPELKMTPEQVERIADHIADFSLAYIQNLRSGNSAANPDRPTPAPKLRLSK